jgi:hypothetical protein
MTKTGSIMSAAADPTKTELAEKIAEAVKAADAAKTETVERSKVAGLLLLEAYRRWPKPKEFFDFLKLAGGLQRSRAYELMGVAGGRKTIDEIKAATRKRVQKHREKKRLPPPEPAESSVTVTDEPASADAAPTPEVVPASKRALEEFTYACRQYLPKMTEADRQKARALVAELTEQPKAEAA